VKILTIIAMKDFDALPVMSEGRLKGSRFSSAYENCEVWNDTCTCEKGSAVIRGARSRHLLACLCRQRRRHSAFRNSERRIRFRAKLENEVPSTHEILVMNPEAVERLSV